MAEAGPSSVRGALSSSQPASPPASQSRHSRIHFPIDDQELSPPSSVRTGPSRHPSVRSGPPPILRKSTVTQANVSSIQDDVRRRVLSADAAIPAPSRLSGAVEFAVSPQKRVSTIRKRRVRDQVDAQEGLDAVLNDLTSTAFSDEFDLSHEDPKVLEDVHRAMKLKARREARLKATAVVAVPETPSKSDIVSGSVVSSQSSPTPSSFAIPPPPIGISTLADRSFESEVDFSPSVGVTPLHPVPTSSNGGTTLDWTGSTSEDERSEKRWSLSITKRKTKDKPYAPHGRVVVEKQDSLYVDKLALIKSKIKRNTWRKAEITADQLRRRYSILTSPLSMYTSPVNLATVTRWLDQQEPAYKESLARAEPLTWLKHLLDHQGRTSTSLPPRLITALVLEEYAISHSQAAMQMIPENDVFVGPSARAYSPLDNKSPTRDSWAWSPPSKSPDTTLISGRLSSSDPPVSFEPAVESGRNSIGGNSLVSSEGMWGSPVLSAQSGPNNVYNNASSPSNSRTHLRDIAKRLRMRSHNGSEDALSSRNSISEHSAPEDGVKLVHSFSRKRSQAQLHVHEGYGTEGEQLIMAGTHSDGQELHSAGPEDLVTPRLDSTADLNTGEITSKAEIFDQEPAPPVRTRLPLRSSRISLPLPSSDRLFVEEIERRQQEIDEESEQREYEHKAQMLEEMLSRNYRTRQLLQQVATGVKEYDTVNTNLSRLLRLPYSPVPQEVLDAFLHDPSAVTSRTQRLQSWRAVEDVQERIVRQRHVLQDFVASLERAGSNPPPRNVFDDPINSLSQTLQSLEECQQDIGQRSEEVSSALARVKNVHSAVKKEYNDALSHTSLVYPEISQIVALEESYRNHYQALWDFGLDALTLLLDTVTPFWRNYGKVIGEDVQDFLIIPWYRNEFTGEQHTYPIKWLPRRSFRHWIGLLIFYCLSIVVTLLQAGAAITSTQHCDLRFLEYRGLRWVIIPFFSIGLVIQWCAVLAECCIVLTEWVVVLWWVGWTINLCS